MKVIFYLFLLSLSITGCENEHDFKRIGAYYLHKFSEKDWETLYACKDPNFKKRLPYNVFVKILERESKDYILESFVTTGYRKVDKHHIEVDFKYSVHSQKLNKKIKMVDKQHYGISQGKLTCLSIGMTDFYTVNGPL